MARMPDTNRRAVTIALHRQWGAEARPTDFMVHETAPGSFDDLEEALRRPVVPKIVRPANQAFEALEIPKPPAQRQGHVPPRPMPAPAAPAPRPTSLCFLDPVTAREAESSSYWRRHLRQMAGAAEWAFLGWCLGMVTARVWGWV
jgi:hypothetical protein